MINIFNLGYCLHQVGGKDLTNSKHMLQSELMFTRVFLLSCFSVSYALKSGTDLLKVPRKFYGSLAIRSVLSVVALFGILVGFRTLPLTIFILILNTNSFTTALMQAFWLKIPVPTYEIVFMCGCYLGIVVIAMNSSESETRSEGSTYNLVGGFIASLVAAVSISVSSVTIHQMRELHFTVL
jgi:drug/metabolite transporter (DMT)-like permease